MKKIALLLFSLVITAVLPGTVTAQTKIMVDVNESCGYTYDCVDCHTSDGTLTWQQSAYMDGGACAVCPEVADCNSAPPTEADLLADAQGVTKDYFETLFAAFTEHMMLTGMMDSDGTITNPLIFAEVFPHCSEIAPVLASDFSRETGYLVRRVTKKTRNSRSIPDEWELKQIEDFEEMAADGDPRTQFNITKPDGESILPTKEFEAFDIVTEGNGKDSKIFARYMRSITMPPMPVNPPVAGNPNLPCLKCHGTFDQLAPGVSDAVAADYPFDQAMGYKAGDIRGAWTIKIPLEAKP